MDREVRIRGIVLVRQDVIAKVAEPNFSDQRRIQSDVRSKRETVVGTVGRSTVTAETKPSASRDAEHRLACQRIRESAKASKCMRPLAERRIHANIPLIAVEQTSAASIVVIGKSTIAVFKIPTEHLTSTCLQLMAAKLVNDTMYLCLGDGGDGTDSDQSGVIILGS